MLRVCTLLTGLLLLTTPAFAQEKVSKKVPTLLKIQAADIDGKKVTLDKYLGKVILIVNVASECGLTPQYKGLQALHEKYGKEGLVILGFPSNDFGGQEPGTEEQVKTFCQKNYGVKFDMFSKVATKGEGQHPLYKYLTSKETNGKFAGPITWNFEKFLIGRDGAVIARFAPRTEPNSEDVDKAIRQALGQ